MSGWCRVEDGYPEPGTAVLVWILSGDDGEGMVEFAERTRSGYWLLVGGSEIREPYDVPTHWMPLPEPPEIDPCSS